MDYFTRWAEAYAIPNEEAATVADKLISDFFPSLLSTLHLHTDHGRQFESALLWEVCSSLGINKTHATPYHPNSDGFVEWFNSTLLSMLAFAAMDRPITCDKYTLHSSSCLVVRHNLLLTSCLDHHLQRWFHLANMLIRSRHPSAMPLVQYMKIWPQHPDARRKTMTNLSMAKPFNHVTLSGYTTQLSRLGNHASFTAPAMTLKESYRVSTSARIDFRVSRSQAIFTQHA